MAILEIVMVESYTITVITCLLAIRFLFKLSQRIINLVRYITKASNSNIKDDTIEKRFSINIIWKKKHIK